MNLPIFSAATVNWLWLLAICSPFAPLAHTACLASTYNSRPLPMEVLVDGAAIRPLRRRMTALDLLSDEYDLGLVQACIPADEVKTLFTQAQTYSEHPEDHDNK